MAHDIDFNDLDPGIRETVRWLNDKGFLTVDSGDGVSKAGQYGEGDYLPFPHVAMLSTPSHLVADADRLLRLLEEHGVSFEPDQSETDAHIEASYSPNDGHVIIMLSMVGDARMGLT
jgi:hypothetical protein